MYNYPLQYANNPEKLDKTLTRVLDTIAFGFFGAIIGVFAVFAFGCFLVLTGLHSMPLFDNVESMYWTFGIFMLAGMYLFGQMGYKEVDKAKKALHEASTFHCKKCHGQNLRFSGWMQYDPKFQVFAYARVDTPDDVVIICDDCDAETEAYAKPMYEYKDES